MATNVIAATIRSAVSRRRLPERPGEGHVVRVAEDVAELHEEQQRRRHILKAGHDGMGRKFDQRAEAQEAKQRLKNAASPMITNSTRSVKETEAPASPGAVECANEYRRAPRKNVVVTRGA